MGFFPLNGVFPSGLLHGATLAWIWQDWPPWTVSEVPWTECYFWKLYV